MFEDIQKHRQAVRENIEKSFQIGYTENEDFEKAHQVGDIHPNGKWVWTQLPSGKFDWRVIKKQSSAPSAPSVTSSTQQNVNKKKDFEFSEEYKRLSEQVEDYRIKYQRAKNNKDSAAASLFHQRYSSLRDKMLRLEIKEKNEFYGVSDLVKELRKMGVNASTKQTTSIRGFSTPTSGYEIDKIQARRIEIHNVGETKFNEIVSDLKNKGYEFSVSPYSKHYGGGTGSISEKKKIEKKGKEGTKPIVPNAVIQYGNLPSRQFDQLYKDFDSQFKSYTKEQLSQAIDKIGDSVSKQISLYKRMKANGDSKIALNKQGNFIDQLSARVYTLKRLLNEKEK